jgi:outer membrane protein TolC
MARSKRLGLLAAFALPGAGLLAQGVPLPPISSTPETKVIFVQPQGGNNGPELEVTKQAEPKREPAKAPLVQPAAATLPPACPAPEGVLEGPVVTEGRPVPRPAVAPLAAHDRPLGINLATALRLADARPLTIALAQARVLEAAARLERAQVLWVPNFNLGSYFYQHTGGAQVLATGNIAINSRNELILGAGLTNIFALTDAIYEPLSARQVLRAREFDVQAARNDVLLDVAEAYFTVQQARGRYAGYLDTLAKSRELVSRVEKLAKNLTPEVEVDRARTQLAEVEQAVALARQDWRVASATLTRLLRLDPAAVVAPLEPPHLQVTLISPNQCVDDLVPIGLTSRPELASQQALVQATLERLRQERLRPLLPSILLTGNQTPQFFFNGGAYATGRGANLNEWAGRGDVAVQFIWQAENLGFGNRGRIRERDAQNQQAVLELFRVQDTVAAEVVQAHAQLQAAAVRVDEAARGLDRGLANYTGNLRGLSETTRFGDILQLVVRPQEAVAALQQLQGAYLNYFLTVADYNRAQFRLYRALGYPAQVLACEKPAGPIVPVDPLRPFKHLPPVHAPEPCHGCPPGAVPMAAPAPAEVQLLPAPKAEEKKTAPGGGQ